MDQDPQDTERNPNRILNPNERAKNITERQENEQYRMIFENMHDAVAVYEAVNDGEDFKFKAFNHAAEEIEGLKREELIDKTVLGTFPGVKDFGLLEVFQRVWKSGKPEHHPTRFYKDGRIAGWRENHVFKLPTGEIVTIYRDATESMQMEETAAFQLIREHSERLEELIEQRTRSLQESEEKFRTLVENIPQKIFTKDRNLAYITCNDHLARDLKIKPAEIVGKTDYDFFPKELADAYRASDKRIIEAGKTEEIEEKYLADGHELAVNTIKTPIRDSKGNITGLLGIFWDVTERKRLEELKAQFLAAVTHELRTPLVSISGYLDLVLKNERFQKETVSYLQVVKRNTARLLTLTNDLLDIQRLQAGKLQVTLKPIDFVNVLDNCVKEIMPMINGKRQVLQLDIPRIPIQIPGDIVRLTQTVMNLLDNASKFTPDGGRIMIHVEDRVDRVITKVSDSGIGIREEDLHRVFEPFSAIKKPTYIKGTGLGLSVTKGLIEAHKGTITVQSEGEGRGTTFTITLPKEPHPVTSSDDSQNPSGGMA